MAKAAIVATAAAMARLRVTTDCRGSRWGSVLRGMGSLGEGFDFGDFPGAAFVAEGDDQLVAGVLVFSESDEDGVRGSGGDGDVALPVVGEVLGGEEGVGVEAVGAFGEALDAGEEGGADVFPECGGFLGEWLAMLVEFGEVPVVEIVDEGGGRFGGGWLRGGGEG